jgi:pentatricopeptide repeat protein
MYTSGILACQTGGDWEHAIYLVDRLKNDGYNITAMALTSAISACAARGRADEALQLLDDMSAKHRLTPKLCTYNNVLLACAKAGRWRDAYAVYKRIRRSPDAYHNLLKCSSERRTDEEMDARRASGTQSNIFTYHTLIEALGVGEQPLLIDEVYRHAVLHGVFQPFEKVSEGEIDLRDHSPYMATAAVRLLLELILLSCGKAENMDDDNDDNDDPVAALFTSMRDQLNSFRNATGLHSKLIVTNGLDLALVTGKGNKLRSTIKALLLKSFRPSIHAYVHKSYADRIVLPKNSLVEWLRVRGQ